MTIASTFMSASSSGKGNKMDESESQEENAPSTPQDTQSVTQDISSVFDRYYGDDRVNYILLVQYLWDVSLGSDGKIIQLESSNSVPEFKSLLTGRTPTGDDGEVILSSAAVKKLGLTNDSVLGKEITITGDVYDDNSERKPVNLTVTIVGVVDANIAVSDDFSYEQEDCMFFSKSAIEEIVSQSEKDLGKCNMTIHAKTPEALISLKEELMKAGIVPIGRFELVEDMVRMNAQAEEQSSVGNLMIGVLAAFAALAVTAVTALLRKKEFAVYKMNGFDTV